MRAYGGPTPKRHVLYANSPAIQSLYKGKLEGWAKYVKEQDAAGADRVKTVKKYRDKSGKLRYKGDKGLRPSESDTYLLAHALYFHRALFDFRHANLCNQLRCIFVCFVLFAARSGITRRHLANNLCPSSSGLSLIRLDSQPCHLRIPLQRNALVKCNLTIRGRMLKWFPCVTTYVVPKEFRFHQVFASFCQRDCKSLSGHNLQIPEYQIDQYISDLGCDWSFLHMLILVYCRIKIQNNHIAIWRLLSGLASIRSVTQKILDNS